MVGTINAADLGANSDFMFGFGTSTAGLLGGNALWNSAGALKTYDNGSPGPVIVNSISTSTNYNIAVVLRSSGTYYFIKGGVFTNWTLLWQGTTNNTATLYPSVIARTTSVFTADNIKIPTNLWLPTPLAYDTFGTPSSSSTQSSGPDGQTTPTVVWTGGTKAGGVMSVSPTDGGNLAVNGTFDADSDWTKGLGWVINSGTASHTAQVSDSGMTNASGPAGVVGTWYSLSFDATMSAGTITPYIAGTSFLGQSTSQVGVLNTGRGAGISKFNFYTNANVVATIDNVSYKALTLSSLFASVPVGTSNVVADVTIPAYTLGTQAGLVIGLDSAGSPANFLIAYLKGNGQATVEQNLGGTYTTIVTAGTAAWNASYVLRVIKDGTAVRLYYNNVLIGSGTCSASITGTRAGVFSTYASNTFDNFSVFARGTGNEFNALNNY